MKQAATNLILLLVAFLGPTGSRTQPQDQEISVDTLHYHNYTTVEALFKKYEADNPNLAKLYSIGRSVQGRELYVLRLSSGLVPYI